MLKADIFLSGFNPGRVALEAGKLFKSIIRTWSMPGSSLIIQSQVYNSSIRMAAGYYLKKREASAFFVRYFLSKALALLD